MPGGRTPPRSAGGPAGPRPGPPAASCQSPQEQEASAGDGGPGTTHAHAACWPAYGQAEGDAGKVQEARGGHEPDRIGGCVRAGRELGAMGVAMEDGERTHNGGGDPEGWP